MTGYPENLGFDPEAVIQDADIESAAWHAKATDASRDSKRQGRQGVHRVWAELANPPEYPPLEDVLNVLENDYDIGWCLACGADVQVEQDADNTICDYCRQPAVVGALNMLLVHPDAAPSMEG